MVLNRHFNLLKYLSEQEGKREEDRVDHGYALKKASAKWNGGHSLSEKTVYRILRSLSGAGLIDDRLKKTWKGKTVTHYGVTKIGKPAVARLGPILAKFPGAIPPDEGVRLASDLRNELGNPLFEACRKGGLLPTKCFEGITGIGQVLSSSPSVIRSRTVVIETLAGAGDVVKCPSCGEDVVSPDLLDTSEWFDCPFCMTRLS